MIIKGSEFNIGLCACLQNNYYKKLYEPNHKYIMLEEIQLIDSKYNICYCTPYKDILENAVENIVNLYEIYFKPNFVKIKIRPLGKGEDFITYGHYELIYDIPEEELFYIKLKGI